VADGFTAPGVRAGVGGGRGKDPGRDDARYLPYVLKRLTDFEPYDKREKYAAAISMQQVKDDIYENVLMLFNSRTHPSVGELKGFPEVTKSVLFYGISDYCGKICSKDDREKLRQHIVTQLEDFEPRFRPGTVEVSFAETTAVGMESRMEFNVSGLVEVNELQEEVVFVSRLDMETGSTELTPL
jgi:type VI secretion system protein ImpF